MRSLLKEKVNAVGIVDTTRHILILSSSCIRSRKTSECKPEIHFSNCIQTRIEKQKGNPFNPNQIKRILSITQEALCHIKTTPKHMAVLGDSVFDNQNYLHPDEKDGQARLQDAFPDYHLTFLAVDGHKSDNVRNTQLKYLADAVKKKPISDIILSVGGNDLLDCAFLLGEKPKTVGQALSVIREYQQTFAESYAKTIEAIDDTVYGIATMSVGMSAIFITRALIIQQQSVSNTE